jgi:hypothetical protein
MGVVVLAIISSSHLEVSGSTSPPTRPSAAARAAVLRVLMSQLVLRPLAASPRPIERAADADVRGCHEAVPNVTAALIRASDSREQGGDRVAASIRCEAGYRSLSVRVQARYTPAAEH